MFPSDTGRLAVRTSPATSEGACIVRVAASKIEKKLLGFFHCPSDIEVYGGVMKKRIIAGGSAVLIFTRSIVPNV